MNKNMMIVDVESIGLHGEGFAWGYVIINTVFGGEIVSGAYACDPDLAEGTDTDRAWVKDNVTLLPDQVNCKDPAEVRSKFVEVYQAAYALYQVDLFSDCVWPVESNFMSRCVQENPKFLTVPYPIFDVMTYLKAKGKNPHAHYARRPDELPLHNPLCDARQSARLLFDAMRLNQSER